MKSLGALLAAQRASYLCPLKTCKHCAGFRKTVQSFCTVSESFANFWKSSRLHEIPTKSAPGPGSPACVWAATSRAPGGPCPQLLPPSPPPERLQGWRAGARGLCQQCPLPRAPRPARPGVLLCALAPGAARRPARLPAAEVTASPKRNHSRSSMNPDRPREHRAGGRTPVAVKGGSCRARRASPSG